MVIRCWSFMEYFSMLIILLQLMHLGYWKEEFTRQKSFCPHLYPLLHFSFLGFCVRLTIDLCYYENMTQFATTQASWVFSVLQL